MIIKKIHINNFGKLVDFDMQFNQGLNIIYGENEKGKSTIMAFIKAMFYGLSPTRKSDLLENHRKKYMTWGETTVSGILEFNHESKEYRIERTFGKAKAKDTRKLFNKSINKEVTIPNSQEIGKMIFDMVEESFERSLFIGQIGSVIDSDKNENEIQKRMQNLASAGDETQSFSDVENKLKAKMESIISRSKRIGQLDLIKSKVSELENAKVKSAEVEKEKNKLQNEYERNLRELEFQNSKREKIKSQIDEIEKYDEYFRYKKILELNEDKELTENTINESEKKFIKGDFVVSSEYLSGLIEMIDELNSLDISIKGLKKQRDEEKLNLEKLAINERKIIDKNIYRKINEYQDEKHNIHKEITKKRFNIPEVQQKKEKISKIKQLMFNIKKNKEDIEKNRNEISNISNQNSSKVKNFISITLILLGVVVAVFSFTSIFESLKLIFMTAGISILIAGIILFILSFIKSKKILKSFSQVKNEKNYQIRRLTDLNVDINNQIDEIKNTIKLENSEIDLNKELENIQQEIKDIDEQISSLESENSQIDKKIQSILNEFQVENINIFKEKYEEDSNLLSKIEFIKNSIQKFEDKIVEHNNKYIDLYNKIKASAKYLDLPESPELMKTYMSDVAKEYSNYKNNKLNYLTNVKNLDSELDGLEISVIEKKNKALEQNISLKEEDIHEYRNNKTNIKGIKEQLDKVNDEIDEFKNKLSELKVKMTHEFSEVKELSEIEEEIKISKNLERYYEKEYNALNLAKDIIEESFEQMQQNFGPIINDRCAEILNNITGGKYTELMVSKDFNINIIDPDKGQTHEWKFLSNGTIDQVYFALRLAISEIFTEKNETLPVFLDDSFLQYDDSRAKMAMEFLGNYSDKKNIQVLLFTCHKLFLANENINDKTIYI